MLIWWFCQYKHFCLLGRRSLLSSLWPLFWGFPSPTLHPRTDWGGVVGGKRWKPCCPSTSLNLAYSSPHLGNRFPLRKSRHSSCVQNQMQAGREGMRLQKIYPNHAPWVGGLTSKEFSEGCSIWENEAPHLQVNCHQSPPFYLLASPSLVQVLSLQKVDEDKTRISWVSHHWLWLHIQLASLPSCLSVPMSISGSWTHGGFLHELEHTWGDQGSNLHREPQ